MRKLFILFLLVFLVLGGYWLYKHPVKTGIVNNDKTEINKPEVEKNSELPVLEKKEQAELYSIDVKYPDTGIGEIDSFLEKMLTEKAGVLKELALESEEFIKDFGIAYSFQTEYQVTRNDKALLSIRLLVYEFTGGAHGNSVTWTFVYDKQANKLLSLENIFNPDKEYLFAISDESIRQLGGVDMIEDSDWLREGAGANIENFEKFVLTDDAIIFIFDAYQVGPYSGGIQEVSILLSDINHLLKEEYKTL